MHILIEENDISLVRYLRDMDKVLEHVEFFVDFHYKRFQLSTKIWTCVSICTLILIDYRKIIDNFRTNKRCISYQ